MKTTPQAGGIIFRHRPGSVEILLVSPKNGEAEWIFPKGHLKPRETPARAALRESCEEAGVLGFVVASAGAPLRFMSRSEPVSVDYFVIEAIGETTPTDARRLQWFSVPEARDAVTHADAKTLLARAVPAIEAHLAAQHRPLRDEAFESFLIAEYEHIGESLLRNEADGEKRVTFFITAVGGAAALVGYLLGEHADLQPDVRHPLIALTAAVVFGLGHLTFLRVITRNAASDRFKHGLNRIRRYFIRCGSEPHPLAYVAINPYDTARRRPFRATAVHIGGWLETVIFVQALLAAVFAAMMIESSSWWRNAGAGLLCGAIAWFLLRVWADRLYTSKQGSTAWPLDG